MPKDINRPLSFLELLADKPKRVNYIEPNLIPVSGKILIGGEAKIGKSFCSMELARALSTGTPVFHSSRFYVPKPVKVLLCDKELGAYTLGERLKSFFQDEDQASLELAAKNIVAVSGNPDFMFDAENCKKAIIRHLEEIQPNVMIVDPVSKFLSGSDQDNDDVRRFLGFMDVLVEHFRDTTGLSIVMTHHFRKPNVDYRGNKIDPASSYNFRGGSRWYDDMDSLITMQRHDVSQSHWRLECEPELRHGASPDTFWLDVKPESCRPVMETLKPESRQPLKDKLLR